MQVFLLPSPLGPFCNLGLGEKDRAEKSPIMREGRAPGGRAGQVSAVCPIRANANPSQDLGDANKWAKFDS